MKLKVSYQIDIDWVKILKAEGLNIPDGATVEIVPEQSVGSPMIAYTSLIGRTIDGVKITHYGYPGDSSPDSNSMAGIGDRGNKLIPNKSVALTKSQRLKLFSQQHPSTGYSFQFQGCSFQDDDTAPETDDRIDVYDPFYTGRDLGNTEEMYEKSKQEMIKAGILKA